MRTCIQCGQDFTPKLSGRGSPGNAKVCGDGCRSERRKVTLKAYRERVKEREQMQREEPGKKACKACGHSKPVTDFYKREWGHRALCKLCHDKRSKETQRIVGTGRKPEPQRFTLVLQVHVGTGQRLCDRRRKFWPWLAKKG